jgi:hypothetical protein
MRINFEKFQFQERISSSTHDASVHATISRVHQRSSLFTRKLNTSIASKEQDKAFAVSCSHFAQQEAPQCIDPPDVAFV